MATLEATTMIELGRLKKRLETAMAAFYTDTDKMRGEGGKLEQVCKRGRLARLYPAGQTALKQNAAIEPKLLQARREAAEALIEALRAMYAAGNEYQAFCEGNGIKVEPIPPGRCACGYCNQFGTVDAIYEAVFLAQMTMWEIVTAPNGRVSRAQMRALQKALQTVHHLYRQAGYAMTFDTFFSAQSYTHGLSISREAMTQL